MSKKLFDRLATPRSAGPLRSINVNICKEQFETWINPTWRHVSSSRTSLLDTEIYAILTWEDVTELCNFELVAKASRFTNQGLGNMRGSRRGTIGVIAPPLTIKHTTKRFTADNNSSVIEKVILEFHVGILSEYADEVVMAINYPDVYDGEYPHGSARYITEMVRQDLLDAGSIRGDVCKYVIDNVRQWEEHPEHM